MKFRIGLWVTALALMSWVALVGVETILVDVDRARALGHAETITGITKIVATVLGAAIAVGCVLVALDTRGRARFWVFATALGFALQVVSVVAQHVGTIDRSTVGLLGFLWVFAPAFFAGAMLSLNRGRIVAGVLFAAVGVDLLALFVADQMEATRSLIAMPTVAYIVWAFLVVDVLDGFPSVGPLPSVSVATVERRLARVVSTALIIVGLAVMSVSVWASGKLGTISPTVDVILGLFAFLAGAIGLWRLRGRGVSAIILVSIIFVFCVGTPMGLRMSMPPPEDAELVDIDGVPGVAIELPIAKNIGSDFSADRGYLELVPLHHDLGRMMLSWGEQPLDVHGVGNASPADLVFEVHGQSFALDQPSSDRVPFRYLTWQCAHGKPVFTLSVSLDKTRQAIAEKLLRRIATTVRCR